MGFLFPPLCSSLAICFMIGINIHCGDRQGYFVAVCPSSESFMKAEKERALESRGLAGAGMVQGFGWKFEFVGDWIGDEELLPFGLGTCMGTELG